MSVTSSNIVLGSLFALAAFFCMAVFGILAKFALLSTTSVWASFLAYLTGSVILLIYIVPRGISTLKSERVGALVARAVFGTAASFLYTVSIQYIPIVNGTLLFNTAPIFIPILATVWLKKSIEKFVWCAVALGFAGIIVIIKPTAAILTQTGNIIALVSGLCLAIAYLVMKLLTSTEPAARIIFYYLGVGTLLQIPLLPFAGELPSAVPCFYAAASGIALLFAQLALVKAYRYADASQVGIYQYASVIFVGLLNWILWAEVPPLSDLFGVLLVAIAGMIIIRSGRTAGH